jgi:hypothetical protein
MTLINLRRLIYFRGIGMKRELIFYYPNLNEIIALFKTSATNNEAVIFWID